MHDLSKVEVYTERGAMLSLPLQGPTSGFQVKGIDGLDPSKVTFSSTSVALLAGEEYQAERTEKRNIIVNIGYDPYFVSKSIQLRKLELYGFFMPGSKIRLRIFMEGVPTVEIEGRVESCEAPLMSQDPRVVISVICFKPDLISIERKSYFGYTTSDVYAGTIDYLGSVESGFTFKMVVDRPSSGFTIHRNFENGSGSALKFAGDLLPGDEIKISTFDGAKIATLTRPNTVTVSYLSQLPVMENGNKVWPACTSENGPYPCVWEAKPTPGSAVVGDSYYIDENNIKRRIARRTAQSMLGKYTGEAWPACENEDGPGLCVWDNEARGNGLGYSYYLPADPFAAPVEIDTQTARAMLNPETVGVETSVLYGVAPNADWIKLQPGTNAIRVESSGFPMPFTIEYNERFGGL